MERERERAGKEKAKKKRTWLVPSVVMHWTHWNSDTYPHLNMSNIH